MDEIKTVATVIVTCAGVAIAIIIMLASVLLTTLVGLIYLPVQYFSVMITGLTAETAGIESIEGSRLGRAFHVTAHVDKEHSFPHYFFGPVEVDIKNNVHASSRRVGATLKDGWRLGTELFDAGPWYFGTIVGVGILIGLVPAGICGIIATVMVAAINIIVIIVGVWVASLMSVLLRCADTSMRFIAGIRMTCPVCAHAVRPYASYKCPSCGELHRDIRPGRRGVVFRVCRCGHGMPALLLIGASQLSAVCPSCSSDLPRRFGKIPEIVIPFFGSVKAGKTQLIYTLVLALSALVAADGGVAELSSDTSDELKRIGSQIGVSGSPGPTVARSPEAFILHIKLGLNERYIFLFDAAGELHYRSDSLDDLRYLDKAKTLVFVADPLSAEGIWTQFGADQQSVLAPARSDWAEVELAYELPREQMRRMGSKGRQMQLAFVMTKEDLLAEAQVCEGKREALKEFVCAPDGMDMGNLVREAEQNFNHVEFFRTAAITDEAGIPDDSIEALARWLLRSEGITFDER